jgi:hypothetical protein
MTATTALLPDAMPGYDTPAPAKRAKPKPKAAPKAKAAPAPIANRSTVRWATFGVGFTLILSALLNGYANAQHAPIAFAGWLMGVSIPVIVLTLAKVAGEKYRDHNRPVAYLAGGSGIALLFLSVWHCSASIAILTGSSIFLAVPLAVAIDAGLVAMEIALVSEPRD